MFADYATFLFISLIFLANFGHWAFISSDDFILPSFVKTRIDCKLDLRISVVFKRIRAFVIIIRDSKILQNQFVSFILQTDFIQ